MLPNKTLLLRFSHVFPMLPQGWFAIPLRLIIGFGFMQHGYAKLARGPDSFIDIVHAMGTQSWPGAYSSTQTASGLLLPGVGGYILGETVATSVAQIFRKCPYHLCLHHLTNAVRPLKPCLPKCDPQGLHSTIIRRWEI
jgi:hypothetical protein